MPMSSKTVPGPTEQNITFVKLAINETWLIMATTGQGKYHSSSFGRTSLLECLREEVQKLCDGEESSAQAVVTGRSEYCDPMAEVEQVDQDGTSTSPSKTRGRGQKRTRYYQNHASKKVVTLNMPAQCPEENANCTEVRKIRLYIEDRQQIWLDLEDVEWAVRYLYIQNLLKGVPLIPEGSTGPDTVS